MRINKRQQHILAGLAAGLEEVDALANEFGVSTSTIRRELAQLEQLGHVHRTYGGAVLVQHPVEPDRAAKGQELLLEKTAIAQRANELIPDGATVLLGAGSTSGRLAWQLRNRQDLTVATNGVETIAILAGAKGVNLVVLGGQVRHTSQAILGPVAEDELRRMTFDFAFIGADGVDATDGICCPTAEVASIKTRKMSRARRVVLLADRRKLGHRPFDHWAPLDADALLLTDKNASTEQLAEFGCNPMVTVETVQPYQLSRLST